MSYKSILQTALSFILGAVVMFEILKIYNVIDQTNQTKPNYLCIKGNVYETLKEKDSIYIKTNIECLIRETIQE